MEHHKSESSNQARELLQYCKGKAHAEHEFKEDWDADVLSVGGKTFAMIGAYKDGRPLVTLKADPERSPALREAYGGIVIPGYYSNKKHWNSIFLDVDVERALLHGLVDDSYELVLKGLPKKVRTALSSGA